MSQNTLTATLTNASAVVLTLDTADTPSAKKMIQSITNFGGLFDDRGDFYPLSAILKIAIT